MFHLWCSERAMIISEAKMETSPLVFHSSSIHVYISLTHQPAPLEILKLYFSQIEGPPNKTKESKFKRTTKAKIE